MTADWTLEDAVVVALDLTTNHGRSEARLAAGLREAYCEDNGDRHGAGFWEQVGMILNDEENEL